MEIEIIVLIFLISGLLIVFSVDTVQKRRHFLAGQDK